MAAGDHVYVWRYRLYTHHGIDLGDGTVIHFTGEPGQANRSAAITRSSLEEFARGATLHVQRHDKADDPEAVLERALSRLGEHGYDLFRNNCEHFATWCVTGRGISRQVRTDTISMATLLTGVVVAGVVAANRPGTETRISAAR